MKLRELTNMKVFVLLMGHLHTVYAVTHSLKYFYTGISGGINFPEFTTVGLVDEVQFMYFDSNTRTAVPKTEWMEREGPDYWDSQTRTGIGLHQIFKANINIARDRYNQSKSTGAHVFQWMYGCEWDNETEATGGFDQYGYDGEDFLSFDLNTKTWIAPKPQAVITKEKWDNNKDDNKLLNSYVNQECVDWLKKYVDYGKTSLMRTVRPSVSLLKKTPSSPVTCHATGFYPSRVMMTWQKDGQDHHEDVEVGEILPNDDGTFQTSVHLNVDPEEWKNNKYQCVVQVSGIQEDFIKVLTEDEIQTNWGVNDPTSMGPIIGVVIAGLLVITAVVIEVVIWKKKSKKGFVPANSSESDSNSSNDSISSKTGFVPANVIVTWNEGDQTAVMLHREAAQ